MFCVPFRPGYFRCRAVGQLLLGGGSLQVRNQMLNENTENGEKYVLRFARGAQNIDKKIGPGTWRRFTLEFG